MAGCMCNAEYRLDCVDDGLRCNATSPEHGDLALVYMNGIDVVGLIYILDADKSRIAQVSGRALHSREAGCDLDGTHGVAGFEWPHGATPGAVQAAPCGGGHVGLVP